MDNSVFITQLEHLGLTPKESIVYLALLNLGQVGTSRLLEETKLHGQYVYQALAALETKGLASHVIMRGRKKFSAKHPRVLMSLIEEKRRVAKSVTEQLESQMVLPKQQETEVFQGKESYIAHEFELLEDLKSGSEILVIGGEGDRFSENMGGQLFDYEKKRLKKEVTVRYIGSEQQKFRLSEDKRTRKFFQYKTLPGLFTGEVNTNIYPDVVGFNIFGTPVTSFVVRSKKIAESQKLFFETLWKMGK